MKSAEPPGSRREPPVRLYALIVGILIVVAIVAIVYGQRLENPQPSPVSSPEAGASTGPSPRY